MAGRVDADNVRLKRVYEQAAKEDGRRVLVERLWPRGLTKQAAALDDWMRDIAPSPELRRWYGHDVGRWDEFRKRYMAELAGNRDGVAALRKIAESATLTLVFAARDPEHSSAAVLREALLQGEPPGKAPSSGG
jgi:uncharacterized protein YeaO (DUF488 family)